MARLLDTNLWVDFVRARSSISVREFAAQFISDPQACIAEPIIFELLSSATEAEARLLIHQLETIPLLATPPDLWNIAAQLGRACRRQGESAGPLDLLIAATAIYHNAKLITFDSGFKAIEQVSSLQLELITRPKR